MSNIYLTRLDEKAIVKDHKQLYDKTSEHFKESFANSRKLLVRVCKIWFVSQMICYGKLMQLKSGQG